MSHSQKSWIWWSLGSLPPHFFYIQLIFLKCGSYQQDRTSTCTMGKCCCVIVLFLFCAPSVYCWSLTKGECIGQTFGLAYHRYYNFLRKFTQIFLFCYLQKKNFQCINETFSSSYVIALLSYSELHLGFITTVKSSCCTCRKYWPHCFSTGPPYFVSSLNFSRLLFSDKVMSVSPPRLNFRIFTNNSSTAELLFL